MPGIKERLDLSVKALVDKKAFGITILDVSEASSFTDYLIICSGNSYKQVQAISSFVEVNLKREGVLSLGIEGHSESRWVLMDYNDIVIHIFYEPVRIFYDLEGLWSEVPRLKLSET